MKTLRPGEVATELLRAGKQLTVSVTLGSAIVERSRGGTGFDEVLVDSVTEFGPYGFDYAFKISSVSALVELSFDNKAGAIVADNQSQNTRLLGSGVPAIKFDDVANFVVTDPDSGVRNSDISDVGDWGSIEIDYATTNTARFQTDCYIDLSDEDGFWVSVWYESQQTVSRFVIYTDETDGFSGAAGRHRHSANSDTTTRYKQGSNLLYFSKSAFVVDGGTPDFAYPIRSIRVDVNGRTDPVGKMRIEGIWTASALKSKGAVIVGFDDAEASSYLAHAIARQYGIPLTHWLIASRVGAQDGITAEQLQEMYEAGDSICLHDTVTYDNYTTYDEAYAAITTAINDFKQLGITPDMHFAWPGGHYGLQADKSDNGRIALLEAALKDAGVLSARATQGANKACFGLLEPYHIGATISLGSDNSLADVIAEVDKARLRGELLFINGHHLGIPDALTWPTPDLIELFRYLNHLATKDEIDLLRHPDVSKLGYL